MPTLAEELLREKAPEIKSRKRLIVNGEFSGEALNLKHQISNGKEMFEAFIVKILKSHPGITTKEICRITGRSSRNVSENLQKMVLKKLVVRGGSYGLARWRLR